MKSPEPSAVDDAPPAADGAGMGMGMAVGPGDEPAAPPGAIRRLLHAATDVVATAVWPFTASTVLNLLGIVAGQYTLQLLTTVTAAIGSDGTGESGSYLDAIIPASPLTAAYLFLALTALMVPLELLERALTVWSDARMSVRLQQRLHDKLLELGPGYHDVHDVSETTSIVTRYAGGTQMILKDIIAFPVTQAITLFTALALLVGNLEKVRDASLWMQAAIASPLLLLPLIAWKFSGRVRETSRAVRDRELAVAREFRNSAEMPLEVQLMGAAPQRVGVFGVQLEQLFRARLRAALVDEMQSQAQRSVPTILQAGFLIYAVGLAVGTDASPAQAAGILGIYLFVPRVVGPIDQLVTFGSGLSATWPQVEKVVEILEAEPEVRDRRGAMPLTTRGGRVEMDHVTFRFSPGGRTILDDLSFQFPPGRITAIVARSGAGKSTLLSLITRTREPEAGDVTIDGHNLRDITLASLRQHVSKVSQFPLFLADTARANLLIAAPDATDADLRAACERTGLWEALRDAAGRGADPLDYVLPRGVGEGLSGGQRRLLALTRALLRTPAILLLDEPSTGVDGISRQSIAGVIREAAKGITVLVVDHDMDFVGRLADTVCCLEHGRFSDIGTPDELLARDTLYRRLKMATGRAEALAAISTPIDEPRESRDA